MGRSRRVQMRLATAARRVMVAVLVAWLATQSTGWAQTDIPPPSRTALPGQSFLVQAIGWGRWIALMAAGVAVIAGGGIYGFAYKSGNVNQGNMGQKLALGGLLGAIIVGLGPVVVQGLFDASTPPTTTLPTATTVP